MGPERREHDAAEDDPGESRDGHHAEDVDPGADPERLPVRKEILPRQAAFELPAGGRRPATGGFVADAALHTLFSCSWGEPCPGNGRISASAKRATISPIRIRFCQEMRMKLQWR